MKFFSTYYIDPIKNHYVDCAGRSTRKQFWLFALCNFIFFVLLSIVLSFFGDIGNIIYTVCYLAIFLPALAIGARRLRDGGFSPWWLLASLIPFIGAIILLVMFVWPSKN
ncbi:MAG: DUF805 domain-containing protein [Elusimicrobiaceae bacterium]|nr:DUF805 domain-containing protein [Elusimicrobiaceae bacterium]